MSLKTISRDEIIRQVLDVDSSNPAVIAKTLTLRQIPTLSGRGEWTDTKVRTFKKRLLAEARRQYPNFK